MTVIPVPDLLPIITAPGDPALHDRRIPGLVIIGPDLPWQERLLNIVALSVRVVEQFATWKLFTTIISFMVWPTSVELKTVTFLSVEDVILLPLMTETLRKLAFTVAEVILLSKEVEFSKVALT